MKVVNLLSGISYNMPKMISSEYQSHGIKIKDFKISLLVILILLAPRGWGVDIVNLLLGMSYNMPKMLSSENQSHSIKIEDFKINPINPFNPNKTKRGKWNILLRIFQNSES